MSLSLLQLPPPGSRVAVGLSGGVDSSVAAAMLKDAGCEVIGITMRIWDGSVTIEAGLKEACYGPGEDEDIEACAELAKKLGIDYFDFDLSKAYTAEVLDYFRREYAAGRTPNPCVRCNQQMKFGFLLSKAREAGVKFDYFATGHYARILCEGDSRYIAKAQDLTKDQSYFIFRLEQRLLNSLRFPLGSMTKPEVRAYARKLGLATADKAESQDFISGGDYSPLFSERDIKEGDIVDKSGRILGRHRGIVHYTIGQRRGLGISSELPLYVESIDAAKNQIIVTDNEALFAEGLEAEDSFLSPGEFFPLKAEVKIRHNHKAVAATIESLSEGTVRVIFDIPQRAVAPGQSVVFYRERDGYSYVAGGGTIRSSL